jgi:hypothetical protein
MAKAEVRKEKSVTKKAKSTRQRREEKGAHGDGDEEGDDERECTGEPTCADKDLLKNRSFESGIRRGFDEGRRRRCFLRYSRVELGGREGLAGRLVLLLGVVDLRLAAASDLALLDFRRIRIGKRDGTSSGEVVVVGSCKGYVAKGISRRTIEDGQRKAAKEGGRGNEGMNEPMKVMRRVARVDITRPGAEPLMAE